MKTAILGLLAETAIHPGAGQNEGAIDLPVAREKTTGYPFIAGSSLKGALLDTVLLRKGISPSILEEARKDSKAEAKPETDEIIRQFGGPNRAADLLIADACLLLLPVRSLSGTYRWATCRLLLERLQRSRDRVLGKGFELPPDPGRGRYLGKALDHKRLFLEELSFGHERALDPDAEWCTALAALIRHDDVRQRLADQLVVLNNEDFAWFAANGLPVRARNVLDENKTSQNLWYEETLAPDTLLFSIVQQRSAQGQGLLHFMGLLSENPYLQAGGNETVGQGWFAATWQPRPGKEAQHD